MVITGHSIINAFSLVNILLPLGPIWILLVQRTERSAWANWLLTLCIYSFCTSLIPFLPVIQHFSSAVTPLTALIEFTLQYYLLRQLITQGKSKDLLQLLLVAFVSIVLTLYWQQGTSVYHRQINVIESGVLIFLSLAGLIQLTFQRQIVIFRSPLFWIACGTLIFYGNRLLIEYLAGISPVSPEVEQQKLLLGTVSNAFRMLTFIVATRIRSTTYF
ncbi:MAG: hypothetical protein QM731_15160 [Chitinophagaceae bacterium]